MQRIKDYVRKRHEDKELKIKRAQQQIKFLADLEKAKDFDRKRLLKHSMFKFQNISRWKIRNEIVSMEMQRRIIFRNIFTKWKHDSVYVCEVQKMKAVAFYNQRCLRAAWSRWQEKYSIAQSNKWTAVDWFHLRLSERVFQGWNRVAAHTRNLFEIPKAKADAHFNW